MLAVGLRDRTEPAWEDLSWSNSIRSMLVYDAGSSAAGTMLEQRSFKNPTSEERIVRLGCEIEDIKQKLKYDYAIE